VARVYVRVPKGSVITIGDRVYTPSSGKTTLPAGTTEFNVTIWRDSTQEQRDAGWPERYAIYLPAIPVGTTSNQIEEMYQQSVQELVDSGVTYGSDEQAQTLADMEDFA
jgi:hypothetical protein